MIWSDVKVGWEFWDKSLLHFLTTHDIISQSTAVFYAAELARECFIPGDSKGLWMRFKIDENLVDS
jgi:hypothetical protein